MVFFVDLIFVVQPHQEWEFKQIKRDFTIKLK